MVDGESLKLETSENRMEGQLQHSLPACLNCLFHFRGKKLSKNQIERVKRLWLLKDADEGEDLYYSFTGKHSKFRRKGHLGGTFYSPVEEDNKDVAGAEGNLEIARVSSYENGKKSKGDGNRVNANNVVESQHAESNKNQPEVESRHEVGCNVMYMHASSAAL